jgi:hypothetical protein
MEHWSHRINISSIAGLNRGRRNEWLLRHQARRTRNFPERYLQGGAQLWRESYLHLSRVPYKRNFFDNIDSVTANENMMQPEDIASTILHALQSPPNYHHVEIEVRPLMPKGSPKTVSKTAEKTRIFAL